jgi:hypothetical protein
MKLVWAEDRATRARDPSAVPGATTEWGGTMPPLFISEWHQSDKRTPALSATSSSSFCSSSCRVYALGIALDYSSCGTTFFSSRPFFSLCGKKRTGCAGPLIWIRRVAPSFQHSQVTTWGTLESDAIRADTTGPLAYVLGEILD